MNISFGSKHLLALQIDNGVTQVAELRVYAKNVTVLKSFSVLTPAGTVEDDGTLVANLGFAKVLREQMKLHGIKADRGVFCVNSDRIISREIVVPNLKRAQLLTMLNTNAQDYFPVDVSDYKLDYSVQEQFSENGVKMLRVLARAVPKALILSYYTLARMMEIGIEAIDISGNSVLQAVAVNSQMLAKEEDTEGSTYMVANLYSGGTQLTFVKDGTVRLQRTISMGLDDSFEKLLLLNSEPVGNICGYKPTETDEQTLEEITRMASQKATELAFAINRIIEYYYSVEGYGNGKVYGTVIGQGILLPAFVSRLFESLDMPYRLPHRTSVQADDPGKLGKEYGLYLPCIGACLNPLNLTDTAQGIILDNICAKRRWLERGIFVKNNFILLAGVSVFAICLLVSAVMAGVVTVQDLTLKSEEAELDEKEAIFSDIKDYKDILINAESIRDLLQSYQQKAEQLEQDKLVYEELKAESEELAEMYLALQDACEQLGWQFEYANKVYTEDYAVYDDFSKSIWSWYNEIMYTLDEDYMNTNNDNLMAFFGELEEKMPKTFTVTAIAITDGGVNMAIEVQSTEQALFVMSALREFETVKDPVFSGLTIINGTPSGVFEEEVNGNPNVRRVRFTVSLKYADAFRDQ